MQRGSESQGGFSPAYSGSLEGHAADKAAQQGFARGRDAASSPAHPVQDQQPAKVSFDMMLSYCTCISGTMITISIY